MKEYDPQRAQLKRISVGGSIGDASLLTLEYNYATVSGQTSDNNGALRNQTITLRGISALEQNYTYDALNRIDEQMKGCVTEISLLRTIPGVGIHNEQRISE